MTLVLVFCLGTAARAQSFEFQYHGASVADGGMVTIAAERDAIFDELCCATNPSADPSNGLVLKLLSGTSASGKATLTITDNTLNASTVKWCMGGTCDLMTEVEQLTKDFTVDDGQVQVQFDAENILATGYLLATLSATIGGETHTVKIQFTNGAAATSQVWWGYFTDSDAANINYSSDGLGSGSAATYDAAISVPAGDVFVSKSTIKAVRIWLGKDVTKISGSLKLWISKTLPTDIANADYLQEIPVSSLLKGKNEIELSTPYEVNGEAVNIGYSIKTSGSAYPIICKGTDIENGFLLRYNGGDWSSYYGSDYGNLALQLLLEGESYPANSITPVDFGQTVILKGGAVVIPVTIKNTGTETVKKLTYTIATEGGTTTDEKTVTLSTSMAFNEQKTLNIRFMADEDKGKRLKTLTINTVNNVANESENGASTGYLITIDEKPRTIVPVVEEFTGTWCGYCPYGIVGMQQAHDQFGDQVVLIAAHDGDPMQIKGYEPVVSLYANGYPSSRINREGESIYPYGFTNSISKALTRTVQGSVKMNAYWSNEDQTAIDFVTETTFVYDEDSGQYGIAFVLVEDGLKGTGSQWAQSNYLSGGSGYDDLSFWYSSPSTVTGMEFDHVAVAAWDILTGVEGSVNPVIRSDAAQKFSYRANIGSNTLIQDKTKLTAVALLIDHFNGTIVNAAQANIQAFGAGIRQVDTENTVPAGYYSLDGRQLPVMHKGLNIVRLSDGRSVKVVK